MISTLAVHAMRDFERVDELRIYDGGLPQRRDLAPLGYKLVFSVEGLINEYLAKATALRDGRRVEVDALSEVEELELPAPLGRCEAGHAAGGLSTLAWTYEGRVGTLFNKLIRYPGHIAVMRALAELGFFGGTAVETAEGRVTPRALSARLLARAFDHPAEKDLVFIRVVARGRRGGAPAETVCELLDLFDERTGLTAMMRTTGFPAAIVAQLMARGAIAPGARPVELAVPSEPFLAEAERRGFRFTWRHGEA
jgi:lysine 6-dehydrogenase